MKLSWPTILVSLPIAYALDIYVSPSGSDSNAGTFGSPFLTLTKAQTAVRAAAVSSQLADITVHIADGVYTLSSPLLFTAADSGKNGHTVYWTATGSNALISGGTKLTGWTLNSTTGIYSTTVPKGTQSRNLYIDGWAAQYARASIDRSTLSYDNNSITWTASANDWIASIPGIEYAEIRAVQSFTDRYSGIKSATVGKLIMDQPAWHNNVWGYDDISHPFSEREFYIQNALSLLTDGAEYYLDSSAGIIYYKPLTGQNMASATAYLGHLEVLIAIGGTYDAPAHDIAFQGLNFVGCSH